ncbi:MAG: nitrogen regulation protein NR(II) [Gemmatimonadales bacterium]
MSNLLQGLWHALRAERGSPSPPDVRRVLRWIYVGRTSVAIAVFVAAAFYFKDVLPARLLLISVAALLSVIVSAVSIWYTEIRRVAASETYLYAQAMFDLALVTVVVHVTGGVDSNFASLYILVIALSSLLLPLAAALLTTILAGILYFAVIFWFNPVQLSLALWLQLAVFAVVALVSVWIASRVRIVGAERAVLEREVERLRLEASDILQNLRSGILTVDRNGYVAYANPPAGRLLGFGHDAMIGTNIRDRLSDRAPDLARVIESTLSQAAGVQRFEAQIDLPERSFPIGVTTTIADLEDDSRVSVTAIFTDISDRKRLEELKLRNERLEAVAELSASLAHEIKNPLASIRSSVEQLSASMRAGEDERFLAQLVVRESDRLSRLLTEFLDFSRVRVTKSSTLALGEIAEAVAKMLREHPDCREGSEILVAAGHSAMEGDEDLLHRVVFNLVLNALQAGGKGTRVNLEVRMAEPSDLPPDVTLEQPVLLRVTDNGPGIPKDVQARLFDPFVTGRVGGTGLGLAIVQRAVEAHRGLVFVESTEGVGTTFSVFLPCRSEREVAA